MARKVFVYTFQLNPSLLSTVVDYVVSNSRGDILSEDELIDMVYDFFYEVSGGDIFVVDTFRGLRRGRKFRYYDGVVFDSVDDFIKWLQTDTDFINDLIDRLEGKLRFSENRVMRVGKKEIYYEIELDDLLRWKKSILSSDSIEVDDIDFNDFFNSIRDELIDLIDSKCKGMPILFVFPSRYRKKYADDFTFEVYGAYFYDTDRFMQMVEDLFKYPIFYKDFKEIVKDL